MINIKQFEIVDIPAKRVKFFGAEGKMLLPNAESIAEALSHLPHDKLITTGLLRNYLTRKYAVQGTCPVTTKKALLELAQSEDSHSPYWRVINQNGTVIANLPDGINKLRQDGFTIAENGKTVTDYKAFLAGL